MRRDVHTCLVARPLDAVRDGGREALESAVGDGGASIVRVVLLCVALARERHYRLHVSFSSQRSRVHEWQLRLHATPSMFIYLYVSCIQTL